MKFALPALVGAAAFVVPTVASAKQVTLQTTLKAYGGPEAYAAIWLADAAGQYKGTLWVAGPRSSPPPPAGNVGAAASLRRCFARCAKPRRRDRTA